MLDPLPQNQWSRRKADHLHYRAGYGGTPEEREAFYQLGRRSGVAAAVDSLMNPEENWNDYPFPDWTNSAALLKAKAAEIGILEFTVWYLNHLRTARPVTGKMIKFFVDHFPIDWGTLGNKTQKHYYLFKHIQYIRSEAVGNFRQLVIDISRSEGMIKMLDLEESKVNSVNENFGRELLELFTLGVDGGYTEEEVQVAAAAFTGYKVRNYRSAAADGNYPFAFYIFNNHVDSSSKRFFVSQSSAANLTGGNQGDQAIDILTSRSACARHLSWKLWRYFVSPEPDSALLDALAVQLKDVHDYNLKPFLRELFLSEEFYAEGNIGRQVRDPLEYVLGTNSALDAPELPPLVLFRALERMGFLVMFPPSIQGWPEPEGAGNEWLSTGAMMFRLNFPGVWSHKNSTLFDDEFTNAEVGNYPGIDYDMLAPYELRAKQNFNLLLQKLNHRLLPFHELRGSQKRLLFDRYSSIFDSFGDTEAVKDLLRLIMALPEYQLQ